MESLERSCHAYLQLPVRYSEAVDGYIYARGSHDPARKYDVDGRRQHYTSCQIYQRPYEIDSVTEYEREGKVLVKVKLKERLRHEPEMPGIIPLGGSGTDMEATDRWPRAWFTEALYRTDENGVMEFLYHRSAGRLDDSFHYNCRLIIGDVAPENDVVGLPDDPYGGCYPRAWFLKLPVEKPEETPVPNDVPDADFDAPMDHEDMQYMELLLRCICEAYIDQNSTLSGQDCSQLESRLFDYNWLNLMFDATRGAPPVVQSLMFLPPELRPDLPKGHGMLPATGLYAYLFNVYVKAVNLLTAARVELPMIVESRIRNAVRFEDVDLPGGGAPCTEDTLIANGYYGSVTAAPAGATAFDDPEWSQSSDFGAASSAAIGTHFRCSGGHLTWAISVSSSRAEFRVPETQPTMAAVPDDLRALMQAGSIGLLGILTTGTSYYVQDEEAGEFAHCITSADQDYLEADGGGDGARPRYKLRQVNEGHAECVLLGQSGTLAPPPLPSGFMYAWRCTASEEPVRTAQGGITAGVSFQAITPDLAGNLFVRVPLTA